MRWREGARDDLFREWWEGQAQPTAGLEVVAAVRPVLRDWAERKHGALTYRLAQVLTGHGCFGVYLCRMAAREPSTACHHCDATEDTAQHTRAVCPAWAEPRAELAESLVAPAA